MTEAHLTIKLVSSSSETLAIAVPSLESATVLSLKQLIEARDAQRFPVAAQRLIFQGQILQNDKTLSEYSVASGCALHLTLTPGMVRPAAAPAPVAAPAVSAVETQLRAFLQQMRADSGYATAIQTMQKICENVISHPHEDKYRKLRLGNAALKNRLLDRVRGLDCVKLLGFQDGVEAGHLVLVPTAEKWEFLVTGKRVLDEAVAASSRSGFNTTPSSFAPPAPVFGTGAAGGNPNWASQAQSMLQNPMMAQMLQNDPMMQQMAQMNPMIAQALQNPAMLSQQLQMLQQNPAMMQQMNQMMQDPSAMARVQQMLGGGAGGGGMGGFDGGFGGIGSGGASPYGAPAPSAAAANPFAPGIPAAASNPYAATPSTPAPTPVAPAPAAPAPAASAGDDATFDENEIADAIARSLQDQS